MNRYHQLADDNLIFVVAHRISLVDAYFRWGAYSQGIKIIKHLNAFLFEWDKYSINQMCKYVYLLFIVLFPLSFCALARFVATWTWIESNRFGCPALFSSIYL